MLPYDAEKGIPNEFSFAFLSLTTTRYYFLLIFCDRGLRPFQVSNISTALTRTIRINGSCARAASLIN